MSDRRNGMGRDFEDIFSGTGTSERSRDKSYDDISSYSEYTRQRTERSSNEGRYGYSRMSYDYEDAIGDDYLDELAGYSPAKKRSRPAPERKYKDVYSDRGGRKPPSSKKRKKKSGKKWKGIVAIIILIILVAVGVLGYYGWSMLDDINYVEAKRTNVYLDTNELKSDKKVVNILLLGVDTDENGTSRSDSMILVSLDKVHGKIKMTSFLRDSWVYIPDHDYAKLNAAYAYGGAGLAMDTIEYNFGVKIDHYMQVDYDIFKSIINDLGGVSVEVTKQEAEFINRTTTKIDKITHGDNVKLDGAQALVYCRIRYLDSDFMRAYRQRKVLTAMKNELMDADVLTLMKVVKNILPQVETDIEKGEMATLGIGAVMKYRNYEMTELRVPVDGSYKNATINSQAVLSLDYDMNKKALISYIYDDVNPDKINK